MTLLVICLLFVGSFAQVQFEVHYEKQPTPFPHFWEGCVGSGHALLSLRQDWREQLTRSHNELGFKMVRFHGLLDDDMSTSLAEGVNSYLNVDSMVDFLLGIGMKPILEISFMPTWLASGKTTICHYLGNVTPPSNYTKWGIMIKSLAAHLFERYGVDEISQWYIEVWNEPGVAPTFWTGTKEDYFHLYLETANAFKSVSKSYRVGGPATDCCAAWIQDLRNFCASNNVAIDFVSTHTYSGGDTNIGDIGVILDDLKKSKAQAGGLPLIITEWSSTYAGDWKSGAIHDEPSSAPFLVATMDAVAGLPDVFSYWAFSDVFEEAGFPHANISFYGGFGLLNFYGVPKPAYRTFQLLHQGGDLKVDVNRTVNGTALCNQNTGILALVNKTTLLLLGYNRNVIGQPVQDCPTIIKVNSLSNPLNAYNSASLIRIDEQHTNPKAQWIAMGRPEYLTQQQLNQLQVSSEMVPVALSSVAKLITTSGSLTFQITFPQQGLVAISLPLQ